MMQLAKHMDAEPEPATAAPVDAATGFARELARERALRAQAEEALAAVRLHDELKTEVLRTLARRLDSPPSPATRDHLDATRLSVTLNEYADQWRRAREVAERGLGYFEWLDRTAQDVGGRTDLAELLRLMVAHAREAVPGGVPITLELPERMPAVLGRRRHLVDVLREVLENAVRHAGTAAPVRVSAQPDADAITVVVADSGAGFPADQAGALLRPFGARADGKRGGLGLALASAVLHAHGGTLEIASPGVGFGAEVRMRFALARQPGHPTSRRLRGLADAVNDDPSAAPGTPDVVSRQALIESQLLMYARDLKQVIARERGRRSELENAHRQMVRFAQDLKRALFTEKLRANELDEAQRGTLAALLRAARFKDQETASHIERLSHYSRLVGCHVGMAEEEADLLFAAAPMHDIGKIGVPDKILMKPGKLDDTEWKEMRRHPGHGASMLRGSSSDLIQLAAEIALTHHERWDGSGYPRGLKGEQIPLVGRIVMMVDIYDALRSPRPYKAEMSHEQAADIILNGDERTMPGHFDPMLLDAFRDLGPQMAAVYAQFGDPPDHKHG
jgi:response regulator RpfG family c-di-GMP phosphodiesterase